MVSDHDIGAIQRRRPQGSCTGVLRTGQAINQKLAEANPEVTRFQSDLAQSHNDIGYVQQETGQLAQPWHRSSGPAILQRLAEANPAVTRFEGDLAQATRSSARSRTRPAIPLKALASFERRGRSCSGWRNSTPRSHSFRTGWR